jgi:hypothetical protein
MSLPGWQIPLSLGYLYQLWAMLGWIMMPWLWTFRLRG